eukprot:10337112-Prorocentrum_lima.AAC.1
MDTRDKWLGLKALKTAYSPVPYSRLTKEGLHVAPSGVAQEAARYLAQEQWNLPAELDTPGTIYDGQPSPN